MKKCKSIIALAMIIVLSGCAYPGIRKEVLMKFNDGEKEVEVHLVQFQNYVPPGFRSSESYRLSYAYTGTLTDWEKANVTELERGCREKTNLAHPAPWMTPVVNGFFMGGIGYGALRLGAQALGVDAVKYGQYGASATGITTFGSEVKGLGGRLYTFDICGQTVPQLKPEIWRKIRMIPINPN